MWLSHALEMVMIVPSLRIAIMSTMKGEKSKRQINVRSKNPRTIRTVIDTA